MRSNLRSKKIDAMWPVCKVISDTKLSRSMHKASSPGAGYQGHNGTRCSGIVTCLRWSFHLFVSAQIKSQELPLALRR
jgi:hypothetical protein